MKKSFKWFGLIVLIGIVWITINYYPKLEIVNAYASRIACSCHFEAGRSLENIKANELNYFPISLSNIQLNKEDQSITSSVFGLQSRTAYHIEGKGCNYNAVLKNKIETNQSVPTIVPFVLPFQQETNELEDITEKYFTDHKLRSLLIIQNDSIRFEKYSQGLKRHTPQLGWSMTKSITSALIGIAIHDSLFTLESNSLFPSWINDQRSTITVEHLLHMNTGLKWDEDEKEISDVTNLLFRENDIAASLLQSELEFKPDSFWEYSSGTSNILMKLLRDNLNDDTYQNFPKTRLFDPLNMNTAFIEQDESENYIGSSFGYASLIDWAKFGRLYLKKGLNHKGEQILSEEWISYSLNPVDKENQQYGAHWWLNKDKVKFKDISENCFYASGYMGQYLYVIPESNTIIICTGLNSDYDKNQFLKEIMDQLNS